MNSKFIILIQGSSKNWGGGGALCMNEIDGSKVIVKTIENILNNNILNKFQIIVAAPEYDLNGLDFIKEEYDLNVKLYYGEDASPLNRMINATKFLLDTDFIIRIDALNFCLDIETVIQMVEMAKKRNFDLIKFRDDWPPVFTADIYKIGALRRMSLELLENQNSYHVHPKYYMLSNEMYKCFKIYPKEYASETMLINRKIAKTIYEERELGSNKYSVKSADTLSFHYTLSLDYIDKNDKVLDIACGLGFGSKIISEKCKNIIGADLSDESINICKINYPDLKFQLEDVTDTTFGANYFDKILSFETIEHVDPIKYLIELKRILKKEGLLILSTPQNAIGKIPINPHHIIEFSSEQLLLLVEKYFEIIKVIGIKQGTIYFDGDPIGTNSFLVLKKNNE